MEDLKKVLRFLITGTILVALIALLGLIFSGKMKEKDPGIAGRWETTVSILGVGVEEPGKTGTMAFRFYRDLTGQLIGPAGTDAKPENFTYSLKEDILKIQFSNGETWSFPYKLEGDTLTLTQNHQEITYKKVK